MKTLRILVSVLVMSLPTLALAQSDSHHSADNHTAAKPAPSDAQKSFDKIKTLAGDWEGPVSVNPPMPDENGKPLHVTMRVTSRGNALVHEMQESGTPLDPAKYDHPVTMFYLDGEDLTLVHYCDAGNRPRMVARKSPDGKRMEFDFVDLSGSNRYGHMQHAVFTVIDENHHIEDWTYMMPGDKPMQAHFDLRRTK